ncbi:MAG: isoaspartyl peptidase/L-asparaginase [Chlorobi bacterium]|nr:isoaspartyl peptidase/L-asparaginase [Chlorobiota bacterium]
MCKLIIHGGFFSEHETDLNTKISKQDSLKEIILLGYDYLKNHSSLQTVSYVVSLLEDSHWFNAGTGSQIQSDGEIRMSASIMDGVTKKFAGVVNIQNIKNPILVAEKLLDYDDKVIGGEGANLFASKIGFSYYNPITDQRKDEYNLRKAGNGSGTVGCVALDDNSNLAVATSTGGKGFEMLGRISDSATTSGNFANQNCAVSCTGIGEDIVRVALASSIVIRVTDGLTIEDSFKKTFAELNEFDGFAGAIGIDKYANFSHKESIPSIVYAQYDGENLRIFD